MRLLILLALTFVGLAVLGVISFHGNGESVTVEFDGERAKKVTERALGAGKDLRERIRDDSSDATDPSGSH